MAESTIKNNPGNLLTFAEVKDFTISYGSPHDLGNTVYLTWTLMNNVKYQVAFHNDGIRFMQWTGSQWNLLWTISST